MATKVSKDYVDQKTPPNLPKHACRQHCLTPRLLGSWPSSKSGPRQKYSSKVQQRGRSSTICRVSRCCSHVLNARWRHPPLVVWDEEARTPYRHGKRDRLGVPSVCPIVRRLRATHDSMQYLRLARSSSLTQWIRQIMKPPATAAGRLGRRACGLRQVPPSAARQQGRNAGRTSLA